MAGLHWSVAILKSAGHSDFILLRGKLHAMRALAIV